MGYTVNDVEIETDEDGYVLEADFSDEIVSVIAEAEGLKMNDERWAVVNYMREQFKEHGHTPSFRNMLKDWEKIRPGTDSKYLYQQFPEMPAKQAAKVAGLPKPYGKAGY